MTRLNLICDVVFGGTKVILKVFGRESRSSGVEILWALWLFGSVAKRGQPLLVNLVRWCLEAIHTTDVSCACRGSCKISDLNPKPYKDTMHKQNQKILKRTRKKYLFLEVGYKNTGCSQPVQFSRIPRCPTLVRPWRLGRGRGRADETILQIR